MSRRVTPTDRAKLRIAKLGTTITLVVPIKATDYGTLRNLAKRHKLTIPEYAMLLLERTIEEERVK